MTSNFTFDQYGNLDPVSQLVGKTIRSVDEPPESDGGTWVLCFTDGSKIKLQAHYDDSEVFFQQVER